MGVDISALVHGTTRRLEDFRGRTIAIDAYNTLYQFLTIIRQPDGTPLRDLEGRVTSHLSGLFYRTANLLERGIRPVFVFDGRPPELKRATLKERARIRDEAEVAYREALAAGDLRTAWSKAVVSTKLTREMVQEAKGLLDAMGLPWIVAPSEGEAQASHMARKGAVWAAASQDFDSLLFGAPILVRNLTVTGRRRLPRSNRTVEIEPEEVHLDDVLKTLEITREQLVDLGLLVGTDFNEGIRGIGPKKGLKLVKEHGRLEAVLAAKNLELPSYEEVRAIFLEPEVSEEFALSWREPDPEAIRRTLCERHNFSTDRIDAVLQRLAGTREVRAQQSLDLWGLGG